MFKILLVGVGPMGREYIKVIKELQKKYKIELTCACQSEKSRKEIMHLYNIEAYTSEISSLINTSGKFDLCIVATNVENLFDITNLLIRCNGAEKILIEKPVSFKNSEIDYLKKFQDIFVAYNRRFYSSVKILKEMTNNFNDVSSIHFDFTELIHSLRNKEISENIRRNWLIANSSHVIDLASFISGTIDMKKSIFHVKGKLDWNGGPINFFGMGQTDREIPFTYNSDWNSASRWGVQVKSSSYNFLLQPLEELKFNEIGTFKVEVEPISQKDTLFKPGLYDQVNAFLDQDYTYLCTMHQHANNFKVFNAILNGTN